MSNLDSSPALIRRRSSAYAVERVAGGLPGSVSPTTHFSGFHGFGSKLLTRAQPIAASAVAANTTRIEPDVMSPGTTRTRPRGSTRPRQVGAAFGAAIDPGGEPEQVEPALAADRVVVDHDAAPPREQQRANDHDQAKNQQGNHAGTV